jgi:hypothetical protein
MRGAAGLQLLQASLGFFDEAITYICRFDELLNGCSMLRVCDLPNCCD